MVSEGAVAASWSVAGAFGGLRRSSCSVRERGRSVLWPQKQQLQRLGALQERSVVSEGAVAASGSVAGALCGLRSSSCSVPQRCRSVAEARKQQLQRSAAVAAISCSGQERKPGREARGAREPNIIIDI